MLLNTWLMIMSAELLFMKWCIYLKTLLHHSYHFIFYFSKLIHLEVPRIYSMSTTLPVYASLTEFLFDSSSTTHIWLSILLAFIELFFLVWQKLHRIFFSHLYLVTQDLLDLSPEAILTLILYWFKILPLLTTWWSKFVYQTMRALYFFHSQHSS